MLEVIACTLDDALAAEQGGATRLEVVSRLDQDGLTPPLALVESIIARVHIPARAMIRPRDAFDVADAAETQVLRDAARQFAQLPVDGLVLGYVRDATVDIGTMRELCDVTLTMPITFHRAIDACADPMAALQSLRQFTQIDCVLTSGGNGDWATRAVSLIAMQAHMPSINVLVGGGVDADAIRFLCSHTPLRAFHAGRAAREPQTVDGRVSEAAVAALRQALDVG